MKVAIIGVSGVVGNTLLKLLEERNFPVTELIPVASEKSIGKNIQFKNKDFQIVSAQQAVDSNPQLALFSAGGNVSLALAPLFANVGCRVVDNSSAWRMDATKKLIVPEVNGAMLTKLDYIIANPNCSTIQMVMVLKPLHDKYKIKRVVVSTYQSVTGTGQKAIQQLLNERQGNKELSVYPHPIDMNMLPHIDVFNENGNTKEENKMILETQKIMDDPGIKVSATCVRVPVMGGHSESVNIEFENDFELHEVIQILNAQQGIIVEDDVKNNVYPMPINAFGKDEVFVGRIRRDESQSNTLNCWIVADNLRKGAATNAVQIAEYLVGKNWL